MQRDFSAYLSDIYQAGDDILFFTLGFNREMFHKVPVVQAAVERKFEILGEALAQCRHHYPDQVKQLGDVQGVIDFQNYLAHRYSSVSEDIVWDILQHDLPPLLKAAKAIAGVQLT